MTNRNNEKSLLGLGTCERGQGQIEYALMLVLVAAVVFIFWFVIGGLIGSYIGQVSLVHFTKIATGWLLAIASVDVIILASMRIVGRFRR